LPVKVAYSPGCTCSMPLICHRVIVFDVLQHVYCPGLVVVRAECCDSPQLMYMEVELIYGRSRTDHQRVGSDSDRHGCKARTKKFPLQFFMKSAHSATCYSKIPAGIPLANGNLVLTVLCRHIKPICVMLVSDIWDNETENGE
jgi:hypothetical protein